MRWSEQINEIAAALAQAQGEIKNALMDSQNPHLKNKYANLASVTEAIKAALSKNGISYVQNPHMNFADNLVGVNVLLIHKSGQFIEFDPLWCKPTRGFAPQEIGSAMTYLRRYTLSSAVGVTQGADADDDGERAEGRGIRQNERESYRHKQGDDHAKRVESMLQQFSKIGVTKDHLEEMLDCSVTKFNDDLFDDAKKLYMNIKADRASQAKADITNG